MNRKISIALMLVVCISLAGCGGLIGDSSDSENSEDLSDYDYPDGFAESGVENASTATQTHFEAYNDSSSWTVTYSVQEAQGGEIVNLSETRFVEIRNDTPRELINVETPSGNYDVFTNDSESYSRTIQNNESLYAMQQGSVDITSATYSDMFISFLGSVDYEADDVSTQDGQNVVTYTGDSLTDENSLETENQSVESVQSTLAVDEQGHIHQFDFTGEVSQGEQTIDIEYSVTFSNIGATTVEDPSWLDDAINSTNTTEE